MSSPVIIQFVLLSVIIFISMMQTEAENSPETSKCASLRVRRNIKSLSQAELNEYVDAFKKAYEQRILDTMTRIHLADFLATHHQPMFLLYHRIFAFDFEERLRKINPNVTIPYWDETDDSEYPHKSVIFSPEIFGGDGDPAHDYCVKEGFLKDVHLAHPTCKDCFGCVRRQFNGQDGAIKPFTPASVIDQYIQNSPTFDEFRFWVEDSLHFQVHDGLGGRRGDMSSPTSSNDPFFYLHHSNMDRLHVKWARLHPEAANRVNGLQEFFDDSDKVRSRVTYTNDTPIPYFNMTSGSILHTDRPPLCYTYDKI
ncbi:tyrosinase-like [Brevipalpus obovatus]|uniref:tyrosinase-like n=1 Tax=Brevipalpus obovatus TaxID=246614 RepID=UPI003D9FA3E0